MNLGLFIPNCPQTHVITKTNKLLQGLVAESVNSFQNQSYIINNYVFLFYVVYRLVLVIFVNNEYKLNQHLWKNIPRQIHLKYIYNSTLGDYVLELFEKILDQFHFLHNPNLWTIHCATPKNK